VDKRTPTVSVSAAPAAPRRRQKALARGQEDGDGALLRRFRLDGDGMLELVVSSEGLDLPILTVEVARFLAPDAAKQALERALAGALAKGNVVTAAQARAQLEAL
jgi:hypothetical protein